MAAHDELTEPISWVPEGMHYSSMEGLEKQVEQELLTEYGRERIREAKESSQREQD